MLTPCFGQPSYSIQQAVSTIQESVKQRLAYENYSTFARDLDTGQGTVLPNGQGAILPIHMWR
jgi:hypothetical protein